MATEREIQALEAKIKEVLVKEPRFVRRIQWIDYDAGNNAEEVMRREEFQKMFVRALRREPRRQTIFAHGKLTGITA